MNDDVIIVTEAHVTEIMLGRFEAEASELRLPPGSWPVRLNTTLGNGHPFLLRAAAVSKALYEQELGCISLIVLND